ncbi:unnamed protein product, partial [Notodromas monacha]
MTELVEKFRDIEEWTLATDSRLLKCIESLSEGILNKLETVKTRVDRLADETERVGICVENASNSFLCLSNTQFIENRVYEEDPSTFAVPVIDKTAKEKKASMSLQVKYAEAVKYGMEALNTAFE